jgi:hypothetical protein
MASGAWRRLPVPARLAAAVAVDLLNALPAEGHPLLYLVDWLVLLLQLDLATDLVAAPGQRALLSIGSAEALLPYPQDLIPFCTVVALTTGAREGMEPLDGPGRGRPTSA